MTDNDKALKALSHHTGVGQPWLRTYDAHLKGEKLQEATMTDNQTMPDWVLIEAAKRSGWDYLPVAELHGYYSDDLCCHNGFRALCDMIHRYEQPPVDRKLLCAREALREAYEAGECVAWTPEQEIVRAIELWEEGFGK